MIKRLIKRLMMILQVVRKRDCAPKVFFYHDVGTNYTPMGTDRSVFWSHMKLLLTTPSSQPLFSCPAAGHIVAFDDGFRGIWDEREQFKAMGLRPMVFVAIRLVGQPGYLTWDEIRTLQNDYGFRFECHTWSHQTLSGEMIDESPKAERTDAWFHRELVASKLELEKQLNLNSSTLLTAVALAKEVQPFNSSTLQPFNHHHPVSALCFPVGNFSDEVIERCKAAGYSKVYASFPGNITDAYLQPRNLVQDLSLFDFRLALRGALMAFHSRYLSLHKSA